MDNQVGLLPQLIKDIEPYAFEREKASLGSSHPRPAQPNIYQPNQRLSYPRRSKTREYWDNAYKQYLSRGGM